MKSSEYWQRRMMAVEQLSYEKSLAYRDDLERQYKAASESIQSDITRWYQRFADNNQISMAEAKKLLNSRDLKEFRWSVEEYIKHGRDNLDGKWTKQLENASARVHISRLEALQVQLQQHIEELYGNQLDGLDKLLRDIYTAGYDHTMFEVQRGLNMGWSFQRFNEDQLDAALKKPWTTDNQTFRDRCWTQKEALVRNLQKSLVQAFIRGDALDKVSTALAKEMHVARSKAARLVQTEASYFANNAQKQCYKDLGVERVEVVETLDSRTCGICGSIDGKIIKLSDAEPGITVPPYHPNCRGCTAPYFEDDVGERVARNDEGETYYVPSDMTFEQWKKSLESDDPKLKKQTGYDIINSKDDDNMNVDIMLDEFTPCLREVSSGNLVDTEYSIAQKSELKGLKKQGWKFDWLSKDLDKAEVFKLTLRGDRAIQGLVAVSDFPRDSAVFVNIAESAPHNFGKNKVYEGVGGHLFAIAANESMKKGYGGFVFMDAKNEDLVRHYQEALGATFLGMPHPYRMFIDEESAQKLLQTYTMYKEE